MQWPAGPPAGLAPLQHLQPSQNNTPEWPAKVAKKPTQMNGEMTYCWCCGWWQAYGQTGSGKTYTMQGALDRRSDGRLSEQVRGTDEQDDWG